jgi:chemotaxis protein MotD
VGRARAQCERPWNLRKRQNLPGGGSKCLLRPRRETERPHKPLQNHAFSAGRSGLSVASLRAEYPGVLVQEVASSTQTHAAHARAHGARHAKPQRGSDFAALLDEMAPAKPDGSAEASAPPADQASAPEQQPQAAAKAANVAPAQNVTPALPGQAGQAAASDQQATTVCAALDQLPQDGKQQSPTSPFAVATKADGQADDQKSAAPHADKADAATNLAAQASTLAQNAATAPIVTAQQTLPTAQPSPPADTQTPAPAIAAVATLTPQVSAEPKTAKQTQALGTAETDEPPQVTTQEPGSEQPGLLPPDGKASVAAAIMQKPENTAVAPHRASLDLASNKSDAAPATDQFLDPITGQGNAPGVSAPTSAPGSQAASTTAPAASNAPAPQAQLAPVPLSGIPVLIAGKALAGSNHFDIRLDPPELGRIEVRLKVDRDGQISSHLIADRADTLALLRRDQTGLERALQDAGLKTSNDGLQFSLRDQSGNGQPDGRPAAPNLLVQDNSNPTPDLLPRGYMGYAARAGGIDIHV